MSGDDHGAGSPADERPVGPGVSRLAAVLVHVAHASVCRCVEWLAATRYLRGELSIIRAGAPIFQTAGAALALARQNLRPLLESAPKAPLAGVPSPLEASQGWRIPWLYAATLWVARASACRAAANSWCAVEEAERVAREAPARARDVVVGCLLPAAVRLSDDVLSGLGAVDARVSQAWRARLELALDSLVATAAGQTVVPPPPAALRLPARPTFPTEGGPYAWRLVAPDRLGQLRPGAAIYLTLAAAQAALRAAYSDPLADAPLQLVAWGCPEWWRLVER